MIFYKEWLKLDKNEFMIITMLAQINVFYGCLSDICHFFNIVSTYRSRTKFKNAINHLSSNNIIDVNQHGRNYELKIANTDNYRPIAIKDDWIDLDRLRQGGFSESVHWTQVLKVLLWLVDIGDCEFTNNDIVNDINTSATTIVSAKNVLKNDFNILNINYEYYPVIDDKFYRSGQTRELNAIPTSPKKK